MGNTELVSDDISRSSIRLGWIDALYFHESYADVVLESCEVDAEVIEVVKKVLSSLVGK